MSVSLLSPRGGDTVTSPVAVSLGFSFGTGTFTITATIGTGTATSASFTGDGLGLLSVPVAAAGTYTAVAAANPSGGGSGSQPNVIVNTSGAPATITTIIPALPPPPPPMPLQFGTAGNAKDWYDVKGKAKTTGTPVPTKVTCTAYSVDKATGAWSQVDSKDDTPNSGNWHAKLGFDRDAGHWYVVSVFAYDGATLMGSSSHVVP